MNRRRSVLCCALAITLAVAGATAQAQAYPSRPIQLFVAFAPGGAGDIVARAVAREMSRSLGQPVVIENRPAPLAADTTVARAKPDGHTLMLTGNGTALSTALFKTLPYDLMRDFTHVSTLAFFDLVVMTGSESSFNTIADVLSYAKANPGKLTIGTVRVGSTQNLAAEMFKAMSGIDALIVPYKATADILSALRSKDVQLAVEILPPILGQVSAKSVKPLAMTSAKRSAALPQVPTLAESGVPGFEATGWLGISVPAATPAPIVERLGKELQAAAASPEVQKELKAIGMLPGASTPEQMSQRMKADIAKWQAVIDKAGIERP